MQAFDTSFLTFLFVPNAPCSIDRARERIDFLISDIHGRGEQILIPTPALSELLIAVGHSRSQILRELTKNPKFVLAPFDTRAALELALMAESVQKHGGKGKKGESSGTWAKVKFDRQIVAIARVFGATTMYSEDADIRKVAGTVGMTVKAVSDLSLPIPPHKGKTLFE